MSIYLINKKSSCNYIGAEANVTKRRDGKTTKYENHSAILVFRSNQSSFLSSLAEEGKRGLLISIAILFSIPESFRDSLTTLDE